MNDWLAPILNGIFLAFGLIMPLGIQNLFIFNQGALQPSLIHALPSIITAAICDTLLILLAVLGVSVVLLELAWLKLFILMLGFVFLAYMGYATWKQPVQDFSKDQKPLSLKKQIIFAASVSLLNPHAILDTMVVIGSNAIQYNGYAKWAYTVSCVMVSWAWFYGLALAGSQLRTFNQNTWFFKNMNKIGGLLIWLVASYMAIQLFK